MFIVDSLSNLPESKAHTCYEHLWSAGISLSLFALPADIKKVDKELLKNGDRKWVGRRYVGHQICRLSLNGSVSACNCYFAIDKQLTICLAKYGEKLE